MNSVPGWEELEKYTIGIVEDEVGPRELLQVELLDAGAKAVHVACNSEEAFAMLERHPEIDLLIMDHFLGEGMSGLETLVLMKSRGQLEGRITVLLTAYTDVDALLGALGPGVVDLGCGKPGKIPVLAKGLIELQRERGVSCEVPDFDPGPSAVGAADSRGFVAASPAGRRMLALIREVASTESSVLITGETGAGKEVVARLIHDLSPRASKPFVGLNVTELSGSLMAAELFGHVKGAFTGATQASPGRIASADEGVLLLDEIGDLDLSMQARLLRVLEEKVVTPVGAVAPVPVDVRFLAATHRDLEAMVRAGEFRADLLYRLSKVRVQVPPLRDRPEDIVPIAKKILRAVDRDMELGRRAHGLLRTQEWPGNIRELERVVTESRIAARMRGSKRIDEQDVMAALGITLGSASSAAGRRGPVGKTEIVEALELGEFDRERAAAYLGITVSYLYKRVKRLGIDLQRSELEWKSKRKAR